MTGLIKGLQPYSPKWKNHGTGGGTSFTLDVSSTTNATLLIVGGVIQLPGDYTVSGTTITTTTSVTSGVEVISAVLYDLGNVTTPAAGSVNFDALAFTSQAQGDILYRDSSAWARLPAGTSGQFLKTQGAGANPTWGTVPSADIVLLATTTASGSSVDFTLQNATYSSYKFVLENVGVSNDNINLWMRSSTDGGSSFDSGSSNYRYSVLGYEDSNAAATSGINTYMQLTSANSTLGNAANEHVSGVVYCFNPADTEYTLFGFQLANIYVSSSASWGVGSGLRQSAADVDAVQFTLSAGTFNDGRIKMYGMK